MTQTKESAKKIIIKNKTQKPVSFPKTVSFRSATRNLLNQTSHSPTSAMLTKKPFFNSNISLTSNKIPPSSEWQNRKRVCKKNKKMPCVCHSESPTSVGVRKLLSYSSHSNLCNNFSIKTFLSQTKQLANFKQSRLCGTPSSEWHKRKRVCKKNKKMPCVCHSESPTSVGVRKLLAYSSHSNLCNNFSIKTFLSQTKHLANFQQDSSFVGMTQPRECV